MNDQELTVLRNLRGAPELQADARRYVSETAFRRTVDQEDQEHGTSIGPTLRRIYFGLPDQESAPKQTTQAPASAVTVAEAIKKFSRERCIDLFVGTRHSATGEARHFEKLGSLSKEEQAQARIAAQFHKVMPSDGSGASVTFTYKTSRQRREEMASKEAEATAKQAAWLPPGVTRNEKGELGLADAVAFEQWKSATATEKEAIQFLERQADPTAAQ